MKEDALELAKHRVHTLEKEAAQRQKIEEQLRYVRQIVVDGIFLDCLKMGGGPPR